MNSNLALILVVGILLFKTEKVMAQEVDKGAIATGTLGEDQEEGPLIFKFEPDYLLSVEDRKQQILQYRAVIDTMAISERKKRALLRDLYKNGMSERLSKLLMANNRFEDVD